MHYGQTSLVFQHLLLSVSSITCLSICIWNSHSILGVAFSSLGRVSLFDPWVCSPVLTIHCYVLYYLKGLFAQPVPWITLMCWILASVAFGLIASSYDALISFSFSIQGYSDINCFLNLELVHAMYLLGPSCPPVMVPAVLAHWISSAWGMHLATCLLRSCFWWINWS